MRPEAANTSVEPSGDHRGHRWSPASAGASTMVDEPLTWRTTTRIEPDGPVEYAMSRPSGEIDASKFRALDPLVIGVALPTRMGGGPPLRVANTSAAARMTTAAATTPT